MRPVFKELTLAPEERIEMLRSIRTDAAEEDEAMAARDDIDRVDLEAAEVANDAEDIFRARIRLCVREALARDGEAAGGLEG